MEEIKCDLVGTLESNGYEKMHEQYKRVYSSEGAAPTVPTVSGGHREPKIITAEVDGEYIEIDDETVRVRKLTERECLRLMGVKDADIDKLAGHQSKSSLYHLAGDSIVTAVLVAIFKQMI